jgi:glycosidase
LALRFQISCVVGVCALVLAGTVEAAYVHDTFSPAYRSPGGAVASGTPVTLRLRVTGARPKSVTLRVEANGRVSNLRLRRRGVVWSVTYRAPARPQIVTYAFRVSTRRGTVWYGDDDSSTDVRKGGTGRATRLRSDVFKLTVYDRSFTTPAWLQGAVVYQIFVDRFRNGDRSNDTCCEVFYGNVPARLHPTWNEEVEDARATGVFNRDFFGGDLEGIVEKLDYLKALGVEAIWLTPIFKARSNHRYDTDDYHEIDPGVGGDPAFAFIANETAAKGIRLILDGVFNHTSSDSRYFDRYHRYSEIVGACESPSSPFRPWYEISGSNVPCTLYSGFANLDSLPTLSDSNQSLRNFIFKDGLASVVGDWTGKGADGWRLDVAHELSHAWWRDFRTTVKGYAADAPLIGEITAGPVDASEYLLGNELDGVMNYRFRHIANGFVRQTSFTDSSGTIPALTPAQTAHALQAILEDYPRQASAVSFNLLDSHDTNRVLHVLDGDKQAQRLAALLQFTSFGAPMIYYGDEAGIDAPGKSGFGDPYNRAPYPWPDESGDVNVYGPPDAEMIEYYTRLAAMRRELPALRLGTTTTLFTNASVYAFARVAAPHKPVIVALNKGSQPVAVAVPVRGLYPNGTRLGDAQVAGGRVSVTLAARSGAVLAGTS